ncbi:bifunctional MaoC family dehydratase N-terminal/OB-fold nucleic acid binding domain-containing protein [Streptomyces sp. NPDC021093]|uniref:bifunctional MaoC family dehydratase N-terminal/OB-fold nucleic acid binding domain-containing protein n=1 Tax=Streptomyces sp. NPDC021093 TaxID=3365112 RepID=UPI0037A7915F
MREQPGTGELDGLLVRLKEYEGQAAATSGVGKDLVNEPMIRHWCEATGDGNPAYTGPEAIAPPTMLQAWTMGGLSGHTDRSSAYEGLFALLDGAGCTSVVATDCEQEYVRDLRPGDRITFDAVIESVSERKTTKLGSGYFVTTRMDVYGAGELAGTHRFRILKYAPAQRKAAPADRAAVHQPAADRGAVHQVAADRGAVHQVAADRGAVHQVAADREAADRKAKQEKPALRPRPVVNRDNSGFWAGVSAHRLLIQRCEECGTLRFPWLPGCNACGCARWDTVEASGEGTVFSYVVMHHPAFPAFDPPYAVALVELAEGVRMISNVVGVAPDEVRIGMGVRAEFHRFDAELELPVFRPFTDGGEADGLHTD